MRAPNWSIASSPKWARNDLPVIRHREGALSAFGRFLDAVDWVIIRVVVISMTVMVMTVAAQVFLRYVLNLSIDWAEEVSRLSFVWSVFFAIPIAIKRGAHVGITLLTDRLPNPMRNVLFRAMNVLAVALMLVVAYEAAILTKDQWDEPMATLDVSVGLFMLPLFIGAAHSVFHLLHDALSGQIHEPEAVSE